MSTARVQRKPRPTSKNYGRTSILTKGAIRPLSSAPKTADVLSLEPVAKDEESEEEQHEEQAEEIPSTPRSTKVDEALMRLDEEELEAMLEKYQERLSDLEVRKAELETADRTLDEDKLNMTEAIESGAVERENLIKEAEDLRKEFKLVREELFRITKERQSLEGSFGQFEKTLIDLKDSYEEAVWTRVDLEDLLRKLDRDLVVVKQKHAEVHKALSTSQMLEEKVAKLAATTGVKMKEATAIEDYRRTTQRELLTLSVSLFEESLARSQEAELIEMEYHKELAKAKSTQLKSAILGEIAIKVMSTLEEFELFQASTEASSSRLQSVLISAKQTCAQHAEASRLLQRFVEGLLLQRRSWATRVQKANASLERSCGIIRTNRTLNLEQKKALCELLTDLEAALAQITDVLSIRSFGIDRVLEMEEIEMTIDRSIIARADAATTIRSQEHRLEELRLQYQELSSENAEMAKAIRDLAAQRTKIEAKLH